MVLVGDDPASQVYVNSKVKKCGELGMHSRKIVLPADASQEELLEVIRELNADASIHGILVQSPPPPHIDEAAVVLEIDPAKDVDGFHPENVAKLVMEDESGFVPCTPLGCIRLLKAAGIETAGANAVVIGRSMIVGKPMAHLLMSKQSNATVTVAPFPHEKPAGTLPFRGYHRCGYRPPLLCNGGIRERRRRRDRRGYQPRGRRVRQARLPYCG